jgi:membrane protease YdiL (CAAX protease family)
MLNSKSTKDGILVKSSPASQLSIILVLTIACFLLFSVLGIAFGLIETEVSHGYFQSKEGIFKLKIAQLIQAFGLFIAAPIIGSLLFRKKNENYLGFYACRWQYFLLSAILIVTIMPLMNYFGAINNSIKLPDFLSSVSEWMRSKETQAGELTQSFLKAPNFWTFGLNMLVMAIIPAIGEELLFRGVIQKLLVKISKNTHIAIWLTAFFFSAVHMQFFTFAPRFLLGALLGYLLVWSGSIYIPILAHFVNNALAIVLHTLAEHKKIDIQITELGTNQEVTFPAFSLIISGFIVYLIYQFYKRKASQ